MNSPIKIWRRQREVRALLGKKGKVISWTKIFISSEAFDEDVPYPVVMVNLENGSRVYGQLVDYEESDLKIGREVQSILRIGKKTKTDDVVVYDIKFRPV
jgi:uncharacterized OB-fold protein